MIDEQCLFDVIICVDISESRERMKYNNKNTFLIVHKTIQFALEISEQSTQKKSAVELGPVNENNNKQLWLLHGEGDKMEIVNGFSDYCLTDDGQRLTVKKGTGKKDQAWSIEVLPDKFIRIRLSKSKNKFLSLQEGVVILKQFGSPQESDAWALVEVTSNAMLKTSCFIGIPNMKKLIDIPGASKKEGSQIIIYEPNYRFNQRWNIFKAGEIYVIKSFYNKLNLDVEGEKFEDETPVIQWGSHGKINQFWRFERVDPNQKIFRIYTCYDKQLQLGHSDERLQLHKGRKFTWKIQGYFPQ